MLLMCMLKCEKLLPYPLKNGVIFPRLARRSVTSVLLPAQQLWGRAVPCSATEGWVRPLLFCCKKCISPPNDRCGSCFSPGVSDRSCPVRSDPRPPLTGRAVPRQVERFASRCRWRPRGAGGGLPRPSCLSPPGNGLPRRPHPAAPGARLRSGGGDSLLPRSPPDGTRRPLVACSAGAGIFGGAFSFVTAAKELEVSKHR